MHTYLSKDPQAELLYFVGPRAKWKRSAIDPKAGKAAFFPFFSSLSTRHGVFYLLLNVPSPQHKGISQVTLDPDPYCLHPPGSGAQIPTRSHGSSRCWEKVARGLQRPCPREAGSWWEAGSVQAFANAPAFHWGEKRKKEKKNPTD